MLIIQVDYLSKGVIDFRRKEEDIRKLYAEKMGFDEVPPVSRKRAHGDRLATADTAISNKRRRVELPTSSPETGPVFSLTEKEMALLQMFRTMGSNQA